jgi:thiol-disulfide isomerase/thioredoxin
MALIASPPLDPAQLLQRIDQLNQRQRDEVHLLNLQLPAPSAVWGGSDWRSPQSGELPERAVPLRIVHLWADWCAACKEEFPRLKKVAQQLQGTYGKDVRLMLVSETIDSPLMLKFWSDNHEKMPVGLQYGDTTHDLLFAIVQALPQTPQAAALKIERVPGRELPLPITLVTDADNVVRLAFVGSLEGRYGQFANGLEQLHRTLRTTDGRGLVAGRPGATQSN